MILKADNFYRTGQDRTGQVNIWGFLKGAFVELRFLRRKRDIMFLCPAFFYCKPAV